MDFFIKKRQQTHLSLSITYIFFVLFLHFFQKTPNPLSLVLVFKTKRRIQENTFILNKRQNHL